MATYLGPDLVLVSQFVPPSPRLDIIYLTVVCRIDVIPSHRILLEPAQRVRDLMPVPFTTVSSDASVEYRECLSPENHVFRKYDA